MKKEKVMQIIKWQNLPHEDKIKLVKNMNLNSYGLFDYWKREFVRISIGEVFCSSFPDLIGNEIVNRVRLYKMV